MKQRPNDTGLKATHWPGFRPKSEALEARPWLRVKRGSRGEGGNGGERGGRLCEGLCKSLLATGTGEVCEMCFFRREETPQRRSIRSQPTSSMLSCRLQVPLMERLLRRPATSQDGFWFFVSVFLGTELCNFLSQFSDSWVAFRTSHLACIHSSGM